MTQGLSIFELTNLSQVNHQTDGSNYLESSQAFEVHKKNQVL